MIPLVDTVQGGGAELNPNIPILLPESCHLCHSGRNYTTWKMHMSALLLLHGLSDQINGRGDSHKENPRTEVAKAILLLNIRSHNSIVSRTQNPKKELAELDVMTAQEVWDRLERKHLPNAAMIYTPPVTTFDRDYF